MLILKVLRKILNHPLNRKQRLSALLKFIRWQISIRLMPYPIVSKFTERSFLVISKGMTGATGNLYCGLDEFKDMGFLLHFLRTEDLFVDIGANIGSYTMLASAHIGSNSISIEPNKNTFRSLRRNVLVNDIDGKVRLINIGLAGEKGSIRFTNNKDTINHVAVEGEKNTDETLIDTLDNVLKHESPNLLKVDVEGYEKAVFDGADETLKKDSLKAIIVELVGHGRRYGFDDREVDKKLKVAGFKAYSYDPFSRQLSIAPEGGTQNTIYVRDFDFVVDRLKKAVEVTINGNKF